MSHRMAAWVWCLGLAAVLGGCDKQDPDRTKIDEIHALLTERQARAGQDPVQAGGAVTSAALREVFLPLGQALTTLTDRAQTDRERFVALTGEVKQLVSMVESEMGQHGKDLLRSMRQRLDALESKLAEQSRRHSEEKQLMIRAIEASTKRLDQLLRGLASRSGGGNGKEATPAPKEPKTDGKNTGGATDPADATARKEAKEAKTGGIFAGIDLMQALLIFLTVSLVLLVCVVVFFPGRLHGPVPQIEYSATPESIVRELEIPDVEPASAPAVSSPEVIVPAVEPLHEAAGVVPVPHKLVLTIEDPDDLRGLIDILESYLTTEPYILQKPEPQVSMVAGDLHLRFFAMPTLSKAEHALLDSTVRRLRPRDDTALSAGSPAA